MDKQRFNLRDALTRLGRRTQKMQHNEALLVPETPQATPQTFSFEGYLQVYMSKVRQSIDAGRCCLLMGVLGMGKSEVLRTIKQRLEEEGRATCVFINVAADNTQLSSLGMLRLLMANLERQTHEPVGDAPIYDEEGALRNQLYDWMQMHRRDVVLMLDQIELLERDQDVLKTIRALYEQQDAYAEQHGSSAKFIVVLTSTQSLRNRFTGVTSPLYNLVDEVPMRDCSPEVREGYWQALLAPLPDNLREARIRQLNFLCGGDPYQIERVGQRLRQELQEGQRAFPVDVGMYSGNPVANQANAENLNRRLTYAVSSMSEQPESVAPFLHRYAEMLEDDLDALHLMVRIEGGEAVPVREVRAKEDGRTASLWGGVFAEEKGAWKWRSELTRLYFVREFVKRPERTARSLRRKGSYEEAIQHLAHYRHLSDAALRSLQDVTTDWINTADSPSRAWQVLAHALDIWFEGEAQLLRFYARKQGVQNKPGAYFQVNYKQLETPVSAELARLVQRAFGERLSEAMANDTAYRQVAVTTESGDELVIFPLIREGREYGALVMSQAAFNAELEPVPIKQDHVGRWLALLSHVLGEIALFERQSLSNLDISRVQRIAQENRALGQNARVIQLILTTLASSWGLAFNRCVLLQAVGKRGLRGKAGIGYFSQSETHEVWKTEGLPSSFDEAAHTALHADWSAYPFTPLHQVAQRCFIEDWPADPLLRDALSNDEPKLLRQSQIAQSTLKDLLDIEDESDGGENPVLVVPLREAGDDEEIKDSGDVTASSALLGVLVLDKPFTESMISQDQFDALPNFANQLTLILRREQQQINGEVFNRLNMITAKRYSLQQTLDEIADVLLARLSDVIGVLMVSLWEETDNSEPALYPNRRRSALRIANSAEQGALLDDLKYFYYKDETTCRGPVDQALIEPIVDEFRSLYIADLAAWRKQHQYFLGSQLDGMSGARTVYSVSLGDADVPRGVISFQSRWLDAYSDDNIALFKRLARRISSVLEKARVYEGLSRARRNTDQLNISLKELMHPKTKPALYGCIVRQMSDFFAEDAQTLGMKSQPNSVALFAIEKGEMSDLLAGAHSGVAEALAHRCAKMRRAALSGKQVFIEHAGGELVAREQFGEDECSAHANAGAQASVWARMGTSNGPEDDLLLVLAWTKVRRMNHTERASLPVLAEIAARTNGVIEQERKAMKEQLANSLKVEDYELIEAEYAHQWNKRIRAIRNNAKFALEDLEMAGEAALPRVKDRLSAIEQKGSEALERLKFNSKVKESEELALKPWLESVVKRWNMLNSEGAIACMFETSLSETDTIRTRPIILNWILNELMTNAKEAEQRAQAKGKRIRVRASYNAQSREYEISIGNPTPMPRTTLLAVRSGTPLDRPNGSPRGSGRGIWIASGQVQALLGGELRLPELSDTETVFTLALRRQIAEG
jgi:hypothetical protein